MSIGIKKRSNLYRHARFPLAIGCSLILVWLCGDSVAEALMYQRFDLLSGQAWRLVTANWVHLSPQHLILNLAGLAVVWWLFGSVLEGLRGYILTFAIALGLTLCLLLFDPDIIWYAGFSGVIHGLLTAGALLSRRKTPLLSLLVLLIVAGKLILELVGGANPDLEQLIQGPILVHAHVYGAVLGCIGSLVYPKVVGAHQP